MTTHHPFSPSSLERRFLCPASYRQEEGLPSVDNPEASAGTRLHALIAERAKHGFIEQPISEEESNIVENAISLLTSYSYGNEAVFVEEPLEYFVEGKLIYNGTADIVILFSDKVIIIDWKTGHREVTEAENNWQGAAYALAAMQKFGRSKAEVVFYNPVIFQKSTTLFDNWKVLDSQIRTLIAKCEAADAPLVSGDKQCRYCKASIHGTCPLLCRSLADLTSSEVALSNSPEQMIENMPDDKLLDFYEKCKLLEPLQKKADEVVRARCRAKGSLGCYTLKVIAGARQILDLQAAYNLSNLETKKFLECCSISVPKLETAIINDGIFEEGIKTQKAKKEAVAKMLASVISNKPQTERLVKR